MFRRLLLALVAVLTTFVVAAGPASAHPGGHLDSAGDGLLHPLTGLDHLAVMVAVGVLAALLAGQAWYRVPGFFVAGMVLGGVAGYSGASWPGSVAVIVVSVLGAGLLVARTTPAATFAVVPLAGAAHGFAHGAELPASTAPWVFASGVLVATVTLHMAGAVSGLFLRRHPASRVAFAAVLIGTGAALAVA